MKNTELRDFPTDRELRNSSDIQLKIYIPSTRDKNIKIGNDAFANRIKNTLIFLSNTFGGSTLNYGYGSYKFKGKNIKEKVAVVTVNTTKANYNKYDLKLKEFLMKRKKSWGQDSMGFEYEGTLMFV